MINGKFLYYFCILIASQQLQAFDFFSKRPNLDTDFGHSATLYPRVNLEHPAHALGAMLLTYNNINAIYNNQNYKELMLGVDFNSDTLSLYVSGNKTAIEVKTNMQTFTQDNTIRQTMLNVVGSRIKEVMRSTNNSRGLTSDEFTIYQWGIDILEKAFNVKIPKISIPKPWYQRYFNYILGALGLCAGTYCYVKYTQKK